MNDVIDLLKKNIESNDLHFIKKPILIGGMALEYYGIRKAGEDIDLVICDEDYQALARKHPDKRKDIWGDLGVVIGLFEIWRSIALLDYDFFLRDAVDGGEVFVVSPERLLLMKAMALDSPKCMNDIKLIKQYCYENFSNKDFLNEQAKHIRSYEKGSGVIFGGKYTDK